jgi:hypothetical protein
LCDTEAFEALCRSPLDIVGDAQAFVRAAAGKTRANDPPITLRIWRHTLAAFTFLDDLKAVKSILRNWPSEDRTDTDVNLARIQLHYPLLQKKQRTEIQKIAARTSAALGFACYAKNVSPRLLLTVAATAAAPVVKICNECILVFWQRFFTTREPMCVYHCFCQAMARTLLNLRLLGDRKCQEHIYCFASILLWSISSMRTCLRETYGQ